ncbi:MepB family protein [Sporosarcina ureae]|nr:MepB family protein [Sporosarcina ureae]
MALRVYPAWDQPTSKQAMNTQKWQLPYFVDMRIAEPLQSKQVLALYGFV